MNDPIKEYVRQHRAGFDDLRPSADVFSRIQQEVGLVNSRSRRVRIYKLSAWAVAASLLIGIGLYRYDQAVPATKNETPLILSLLSNKLSSGSRISGLQKAGELSSLEPALMEAIVQRATKDPSSNVRLAAVQIIVSRLDQPAMPAVLEKVFIAQDDPFVQTELIDVIAATPAGSADPDIKEKLIALTENDTTAEFVRDRAYAVLLKH